MPRLALFAALLALAACGPDESAPDAPAEDAALTADGVADRMLERYEATLGTVDGFTVTAGGAEARYTLAPDSSGPDRFGPPQVAPVGDAPVTQTEAQLLFVQVPNVPRLARGLRGARLEGPISRDGRRVYALVTDDPGALLGQPGLAPADSATQREFRVYVGAETFDVYEIYQSARPDTSDVAVTSRIIYSDFREADGVVLPWAVRQAETGLNQTISEEEKMVMGGRLALAIQQAGQMPAGPEREARLAELDSQRRLIAEGAAEATLRVESVTVGE